MIFNHFTNINETLYRIYNNLKEKKTVHELKVNGLKLNFINNPLLVPIPFNYFIICHGKFQQKKKLIKNTFFGTEDF